MPKYAAHVLGALVALAILGGTGLVLHFRHRGVDSVRRTTSERTADLQSQPVSGPRNETANSSSTDRTSRDELPRTPEPAELEKAIVDLFEKREAECPDDPWLAGVETFPEGIPIVLKLLKEGRHIDLCVSWLSLQALRLTDAEFAVLAEQLETRNFVGVAEPLLQKGGQWLESVERYFRRTKDPQIAKLVLDTIPSYRGERLAERLPLYEEVLRAATDQEFAKTIGRLDFLRVKATVEAAPEAEIRGSMTLSLWESLLLDETTPPQADVIWMEEVVRRSVRYSTNQQRNDVAQRVRAMLAREKAGANRDAHVQAIERLLKNLTGSD